MISIHTLTLRSGLYLRHLLSLVFILMGSAGAMAAKLLVPVELTVENGDFKNCIIHLTKNGEDAGTLPGKNLLKIKLDFDSDYLLAFSKPGYITKKVSVNTAVTEQRARQLFEPYKIGVKLFKQYNGVNIVVYNQPVAHIKFNPDLDDFDYDVDYTKSILSKLEEAEQQLEIRAAEERKMIARGELPKGGFDFELPGSTKASVSSSALVLKEKSSFINKELASKKTIEPQQDLRDPSSINQGLDVREKPITNEGDADRGTPINSTGDDAENQARNRGEGKVPKGNLNRDGNQDKYKNSGGTGEKDFREGMIGNGKSSIGETEKKVTNNGGDVIRDGDMNPSNGIIKNKELVIEPNRTITTIKVDDGENATIYRKVLYNWGGLYYFKNLTYSISEDLFRAGTGEK